MIFKISVICTYIQGPSKNMYHVDLTMHLPNRYLPYYFKPKKKKNEIFTKKKDKV